MILTESKDSVTYLIKNKCICRTYDTEYSLFILVSDMIDEFIDCFNLDTVHLEDNFKNVLFIKKFNSLQIVEMICFKVNIFLLSIFFFRERKQLCLWKLFKMWKCIKYFKSMNFHHSIVDVDLRLIFKILLCFSLLYFSIFILLKLFDDYYYWKIDKFIKHWWKLTINILMFIQFHICKKRVEKLQ